ncbi:MAG: Na/Pi cotransporter family protein, partial [Firmicutes bacterium]|nr:Na/Pi cotransporter family protein [Candidatus Caballimonas caccae]
MSSTVYYNIFFMLGGIAIMMFGMKFMGSNLEQVAGNNMKNMLSKMTSNRFAGVGVGAAVTAIINSSTATTVMLVGFVNVGLMTLAQATSVIMGANIGTTITAQILSLSGTGAIDINAIAALICAGGMITTMVCKKDRVKKIGFIFIGIGMIFIGLKIMSKSVNEIIYIDNEHTELSPFFEKVFQNENVFPLLLILIGIVFTALIQSSAAITGILIALGSAINFRTAVFIILGSNIGTCITSIISSIGTSTNAKRTAIIHLLFNLFGCIICIVPIWIWTAEIGNFMSSISGGSMERMIANFHTFFNLLTTIILIPFTKQLVVLAEKIIPSKNDKQEEKHRLTFIDDRLLETPPIAVSNTKKEIIKMADIAKENIDLAMNMLLDNTVDEKELLHDNEDALNFLNKSITSYLTKIMARNISRKDEKMVGSFYHVVTDLERVGDYAENILEYSERLRGSNIDFSSEAKEELKQVIETVDKLHDKCVYTFEKSVDTELKEIDRLEEMVDEATVKLEEKHIERLRNGNCTPELGSIYLQTVSNLERVGDHLTNIAFSILNYEKSYT